MTSDLVLTMDERRVLERANELLPKYGGPFGSRMGALNQACILLGVSVDAARFTELEPVVGQRCKTPFGHQVSIGGPPRCDLYFGHVEAEHESGCSECWDQFSPANSLMRPVDHGNPVCPIRGLPCPREGVTACVGMRALVRPPRQPWVVAMVVGMDSVPHGSEGPRDAWKLQYPDGSDVLVDPSIVKVGPPVVPHGR